MFLKPKLQPTSEAHKQFEVVLIKKVFDQSLSRFICLHCVYRIVKSLMVLAILLFIRSRNFVKWTCCKLAVFAGPSRSVVNGMIRRNQFIKDPLSQSVDRQRTCNLQSERLYWPNIFFVRPVKVTDYTWHLRLEKWYVFYLLLVGEQGVSCSPNSI